MRLDTRRLSRSAEALALSLAAAALLISWPRPSHAQTGTGRREDRRVEMEARQRALRKLSDIAARPQRKPADTRPSYQQVAEDFEQLQLRNHNLSVAAGAGPRLDYAQLVEEAAEVRRRASRLKSTLALPAAKREQKQKQAAEAPTPEGVRAAILSLDALVKSFAWNPVFQRPDVLDAENAAKASRELEEILRLSEQIRHAAEGLGKRKNF